MEISLPKNAEFIINTLNKNYFKAYTVGGCVRDSIMGRTPADWDITTNAKPWQVVNIFRELGVKTLETGIKHGTVTVIYQGEAFEVTTFRHDGEYDCNRRPRDVTFVEDLREDLARRDFTVNAMAYHPKEGLVDCFGGVCHIKARTIACVGQPDLRFTEDALRILRALRFSSVLNFHIDSETSQSLRKNAHLLRNISKERINAEFSELILGDNAEYILQNYSDIISVFIPQIKYMVNFNQCSPYHIYDVWTHTVKAVASCPKDLIIRLTMLLHDIGKPHCFTIDENETGHFYGHNKISYSISEEILSNLRFDNITKDRVTELIYCHDMQVNLTEKSIKRLLNKFGEEQFNRFIEVKKADTLAQNPLYTSERLALCDKAKEIANKIIADNQCFSLKNLAVKGDDLLSLGFKKGPIIGKILNDLLEKVMEGELENTVENLINYINKNYI